MFSFFIMRYFISSKLWLGWPYMPKEWLNTRGRSWEVWDEPHEPGPWLSCISKTQNPQMTKTDLSTKALWVTMKTTYIHQNSCTQNSSCPFTSVQKLLNLPSSMSAVSFIFFMQTLRLRKNLAERLSTHMHSSAEYSWNTHKPMLWFQHHNSHCSQKSAEYPLTLRWKFLAATILIF